MVVPAIPRRQLVQLVHDLYRVCFNDGHLLLYCCACSAGNQLPSTFMVLFMVYGSFLLFYLHNSSTAATAITAALLLTWYAFSRPENIKALLAAALFLYGRKFVQAACCFSFAGSSRAFLFIVDRV